MKRLNGFWAYCKALWSEPINKLFTALDIAALVGIAVIVVDDWKEALTSLVFVVILVWGNYLVFAKQRTTIAKLQHAIAQTSPDVVPMPIETPASDQPFSLRIRNEGKSPARNINVKINYKDYVLSACRGSLKPDEEVSLALKDTLIGPAGSRVRVRRLMTSDQTVTLRCEFSSPLGIAYVTFWECEWGLEWKFVRKTAA